MAEEGRTQPRRRGLPRILLGVTGSVAAVKAPEIACRLVEEVGGGGAHVKVLLTAGGRNFWEKAAEYDPVYWERLQQYLPHQGNSETDDASKSTPQSASAPSSPLPSIQVHYAEDEWKSWERMGDPVEHIELRDWADILILAPLSAHTLAKISHGLCDDTLSCLVRAWDFGHSTKNKVGKPILLAPAMNTAMWEHPLTMQQLSQIRSFWKHTAERTTCGVVIVPPQSKLLACGEIGDGALASVDMILQSVRDMLLQHDMVDSSVLVPS